MNAEKIKYSTTKYLISEKPEHEKTLMPANNKRKSEGGLRTKGYYKKSYPNKPLISIVTVVYNGERYLEEAIESVTNQNYDNIEYIVIDGCSSDKTINIIKKHEDYIDYWVSEPDEGQSDAFIKAFGICNGEWLTWLNGDDILLPGAIDELIQTAKKHPEVECFTGNVIWTTADNKVIKCRKGESWNNVLPKLGQLNVYGPSTFFKRKLYERVEGINNNLHYKMDTDLWWQFYSVDAKFKRLTKYIWAFRFHEDAKTTGQFFRDSNYSQKNHPHWVQTKLEQDYIDQKYGLRKNSIIKRVARILLFINRLCSINYLSSLYYTKSYYGKNINDL